MALQRPMTGVTGYEDDDVSKPPTRRDEKEETVDEVKDKEEDDCV